MIDHKVYYYGDGLGPEKSEEWYIVNAQDKKLLHREDDPAIVIYYETGELTSSHG